MIEFKLWQHQQKAVDFAKDLKNFGLFFDVGTGKTLTMITILRHKFNVHSRFLRTVILCPLIVCENWKNEFAKYSKIPEERIVILTGPGELRIKKFLNAIKKFRGNFIIIMNYEGIVSIKNLLEEILNWAPEVVVLDESHRVKNYKSKRTKACIRLCDVADYRYILSGTPILNTPMDIYSQYRCLDRGKTFGNNFYIFREKYFIDINARMSKSIYFPNFQPRPGIEKEFNELISKTSMRAVKSECLDLPPLVKQVIEVEMNAKQAGHYFEMERHFITFLNDETCTAELAIVKMLRLVQICSGFLSIDGRPEPIIFDGCPREKALRELLEDIAPYHKVIIWCVYKANYAVVRRICAELGLSYLEGHGAIDTNTKYQNVDKFNNDPSVRVFIANPKALGIGINIVSASCCIYYSRTHSLEDDLQSEARNYRGGSEIHEKITRIDIVTKNSVDQKILTALYNKQKISEEILAWKEQKHIS